MGCLLFPLPPSFHYTAARLDLIVNDTRRRNVVEFRHRTLWRERVYDVFREADWSRRGTSSVSPY